MRSRFWIALVAGGLVGGTAVGSFGPFVRARVAERAAGLGAEAQVRQVVPTWDGVELRDVSLAFPGIPGVRVWVGRLLIGWQDHRPRVIAGGRVVAFGTLATLARDVESWRVEHRPRDGDVAASEGGAGLAASGFEVHWRSGPENNADSVDATGVSLMRQDEKFVIGSRSFDASRGRFKVSAEDARMVLGKDDGRWRVSELSTRTLAFAETAHGGEDESHPLGGGDCAKSLLRDSPVEPPHPRVARTRCLHRELVRLAGRIDALVTSNVNVRAHGTRAKLTIAGEPLELRPGTLSLARETGTLVVSLEPEPGLASDATELSGQSTAKSAALKLSVRIPLPGASAPAPIVAELKGGPVRISMLGVRDGDVGLRHVDSAYLESDARLEVPADGSAVVMHGTGRVRDLSVHHPRLAAAPLEGIDLAWHGDVTMALDGSRIEIKKTEVDLGSLRLVLDGRVLRKGDDLDVDLRFDLPIVTCQKVLESVPRALVSDLSGIAFSGSLAAKGRFRFDTARIATIYDVGWDGALGCRVTAAPDSLKPGRFKSIFRKTVYTPGGEPKEMEFGPGTNDWVPYGALGPFMETAVLASEDGRFPRHHGFDQEAIVNSIRENLAAHRFKRGASTISMQLAKNLYLSREKTVARKLKEAILTLYLEQELTKAEMMELYLNVIEYGPMVYGIGPAARHYFHTQAQSLSLGQALYLGSILQNPKKQYFGADGSVAPGRMGYLRQLMKNAHKVGRISDEELDVGLRETVVFGSPVPHLAPAPAEADAQAEGANAGTPAPDARAPLASPDAPAPLASPIDQRR